MEPRSENTDTTIDSSYTQMDTTIDSSYTGEDVPSSTSDAATQVPTIKKRPMHTSVRMKGTGKGNSYSYYQMIL